MQGNTLWFSCTKKKYGLRNDDIGIPRIPFPTKFIASPRLDYYPPISPAHCMLVQNALNALNECNECTIFSVTNVICFVFLMYSLSDIMVLTTDLVIVPLSEYPNLVKQYLHPLYIIVWDGQSGMCTYKWTPCKSIIEIYIYCCHYSLSFWLQMSALAINMLKCLFSPW